MDVSLGYDPLVAVSVVMLLAVVRFPASTAVSFVSVRLYVCVSSTAVVVGAVKDDVSLLAAVATLPVVVAFGNAVAM